MHICDMYTCIYIYMCTCMSVGLDQEACGYILSKGSASEFADMHLSENMLTQVYPNRLQNLIMVSMK